MSRRRSSNAWLYAIGLFGLAGVMTGLVLVFGMRPKPGQVESKTPGEPDTAEPLRTVRLPVSGSPGFTVIVYPDGRSELETPTGTKPLLGATPTAPLEPPTAARIAAELQGRTKPELKDELTQVVVLERGIVDVPVDALVTLIAPDRAVAVLKDGSTSVFYADGRVQKRELRQPKPQLLPPASSTRPQEKP